MRTNGKIEEIYKVIKGEHKDPFSVLGMHVITSQKKKCVTVRAYLPYAKNCYLIDLEQNEKFEELEELPKTSDIKVCFFGAPGSYSEQAMEDCFGTEVTGIRAKGAGSRRTRLSASAASSKSAVTRSGSVPYAAVKLISTRRSSSAE